MGKKIHLKVESAAEKIKKIQKQLESDQTQKNKTKKKRLYSQLVKLRKAVQDPDQFLVDPEQFLEKVQQDKERRVQKKLQKKKLLILDKKKQKRYQKRCLKCGDREHKLADCPMANQTKTQKNVQQSGGYCYKCGSTQHSHKDCSEQKYNLAVCFYCGQKGHIARQCTKNQKGLYRKGGSCFGCGSVRHTLKDCPSRRNAGSTYNNKEEF